ncbi:galanin receptor type 1-like [Amphiura filiformis]|uniref:galanin receptor type 1-like n=1 Tax=Amphiura filiformis TaxID=82378 RepID=UPI003B221501
MFGNDTLSNTSISSLQFGAPADHDDGDFIFNVMDYVNDICRRYPIRPNFVVIFLFVITALGIIGNVALLLVVLRNSYLRSAPNILIINIMIADLLYIASTAPFYIKHEFGRPCWLMGLAPCKIRHYIPVIAQASCIFSITALSRERYSAIVRGLESRISRNLRKTLLTVTSAWVTGIVIAAPVLFLTETTINDLNCLYMPVKSPHAKTYMFVIFAFLYVFPLLFITVHHYRIVKTLYRSGNTSVLTRNPSAVLQIRARKRLAHIVLVITIFFALFWFPHYAYSIWFVTTKDLQITKNEGAPKYLRYLNYYMALANSCLNPWIVFIMSSVHRNTLTRVFDCFRCDAKMRNAIRKHISTTRHSTARISATRNASTRYSTTTSSILNTRI